jgi:hypothetical protein
MKKLNNVRQIGKVILVTGFFVLLLMLSPFLSATIVKAQQPGEIIDITEKQFRPNNGDPDRFRLEDNDVIHLQIEKADNLRGKIEIVLKSSSNVTWWKGITVFKSLRDVSNRTNEVRLNHIATQDNDHGPKSIVLNVSDLGDSAWLTFEKAKAFGAHTPMYKFSLGVKNKASRYSGLRLTFTWERDG